MRTGDGEMGSDMKQRPRRKFRARFRPYDHPDV